MNSILKLWKIPQMSIMVWRVADMSSVATVVDLRSDTKTRPTPSMYESMVTSLLGDHVSDEDPTANKLQERCAKLFGKEDALFVPTGTMGNLISVMAHCELRFQEAIVGSKSHLLLYEVAGCAHIAGVQLRTVNNNDDGTFDLKEAANLIRNTTDVHQPTTALICVENTHNMCGGTVLPLSFLKEVHEFANKNNLKVHMDGARVLNAATYLSVSPSEILQYVDSVNVCFSKGLSAPAGSIIAGTKDFIHRSKWICKALGGTMRQIGVLAGPASVALDQIYPLLHEDHQRAKEIAEAMHKNKDCGVAEVNINGLQTNILLINIINPNYDAQMVCDRLKQVTEIEEAELGEQISILMSPLNKQTIRVVLHHDVQQDYVEKTIRKFNYVSKELAQRLH